MQSARPGPAVEGVARWVPEAVYGAERDCVDMIVTVAVSSIAVEGQWAVDSKVALGWVTFAVSCDGESGT